MASEEKPTIKDFLVYLVRKGILPKHAVGLCRKRKQEAINKGYSITVKEILLEQGYITGEEEYEKLWADMGEQLRIHQKIAEKKNLLNENFPLSESALKELISDEEFKRERHPDVPTDVILTVFNRWKKNEKTKKDYTFNSLAKITQKIQRGDFKANSTSIWVIITSVILCSLVIISYCKLKATKQYQVQRIQLQIPQLKKHQSCAEGTIEYFSKQQLRDFFD